MTSVKHVFALGEKGQESEYHRWGKEAYFGLMLLWGQKIKYVHVQLKDK